MVQDLILTTGVEIPFPELRISVHQPRMKEIAFIGEENFFLGCEILNFSKEKFLSEEDKINLKNKNDFQVFMSIIKGSDISIKKSRICALMVLSLLFPDYQINFKDDCIAFVQAGSDEKYSINEKNFDCFKDILIDMFSLNKSNNEGLNYNPGNEAAKQLADRFRKARAKVAELKGESNRVTILSRYISILVTGQQKSFNSFNDYTVYQLFDEFERYEMKENYELYVRAKLAGAKDIEEVDNWMKNIHP